MGHAPGYEDLARVSQWGGSYAYAACSACSTRAASHPSSPGHGGSPHYKLEVSACKSYSPAILDVLDTILHGQPAEKNLDAFVKKLHSKRVFEEDGLVDCSLAFQGCKLQICWPKKDLDSHGQIGPKRCNNLQNPLKWARSLRIPKLSDVQTRVSFGAATLDYIRHVWLIRSFAWKDTYQDPDNVVCHGISLVNWVHPIVIQGILTAETLHRRSCRSFNKAVRDIVWKIRFPSLILVVLVLWLTEVFNYEGLYLAEVLPALILAIFSMTLILLLRSLHPWQSAAGSKRSETARRGILLRLVIQEGQEGNQGKMGGPLCSHVAWTDEKLETLSQIALEDLSIDAEAKTRGIRKIAQAALSQRLALKWHNMFVTVLDKYFHLKLMASTRKLVSVYCDSSYSWL